MLKRFNKTRLAWLQLSRQETRFLIPIAGITFVDLLILIQMGFEGTLYDSAKIPYRNLNVDLMIANTQFQTLFAFLYVPFQARSPSKNSNRSILLICFSDMF
ncbi:MAG: hypothetical protein LH631_11620 [Alkalinema sp. CAN_BIN05]|nr:hypothetical protein [Alkalinema sp. CAN_BIN05]